MTDNDKQELEYIKAVLSITRTQVNKAFAVAAEIEALLLIERKKNEILEQKLAELKSDTINTSAKR